MVGCLGSIKLKKKHGVFEVCAFSPLSGQVRAKKSKYASGNFEKNMAFFVYQACSGRRELIFPKKIWRLCFDKVKIWVQPVSHYSTNFRALMYIWKMGDNYLEYTSTMKMRGEVSCLLPRHLPRPTAGPRSYRGPTAVAKKLPR